MLIKRLYTDAILPSYQTLGAAAMDLHAYGNYTLYPNCPTLINTGIAIHIDNYNIAAHILPRSGLALKHVITVLNSPGLIDSDFLGEIKVILINHGDKLFAINHGDRIAQLEFVRLQSVEWEEVSEFPTITQRGSGGFGSTGN